MLLNFTADTLKQKVFEEVAVYLAQQGFTIKETDASRPWGGFFVLSEDHVEQFIQLFFPELATELDVSLKLSPKILLVAPHKRLSWQYHHRRSEIWKLVTGTAAVVVSATDKETAPYCLPAGAIIRLKQEERHRLIGLGNWGIVAEIWNHTDAQNPSDEEDIIRLRDDYGRGKS